MCKNHNQVKGFDACLILFKEKADMCDARVRYLEGVRAKYLTWCMENVAECDGTVEGTEKWEHKKLLAFFEVQETGSSIDTDGDNEKLNSQEYKDSEEFWCFNAQEGMMHNNAKRAISKFWSLDQRHHRVIQYWSSQVEYAKMRIEALQNELPLHDKIQDHLDKLSAIKPNGFGIFKKEEYTKIIKTKNRLNELLNNKELTWNSFVIFTNQIHRMLGWKEIEIRSDRNVPDTIAYWENMSKWAQAAIQAAEALHRDLSPSVEGEEPIDPETDTSPEKIYSQITWAFSTHTK